MDLYNQLKKVVNNDLPGISAHKELVPHNRRLEPQEIDDPRVSSVIALIHQEHDGRKSILLIEKVNSGSHAGQIAFPGGKVEKGDTSLWQTAYREMQEEVGIQPDLVQQIGALTPLYIPVSNYRVHPFLALFKSDEKPQLINEPEEVANSFWADLNDLQNVDELQRKDITTKSGHKLKNTPCFLMNSEIVWGATALMINEIRYIMKKL